ncbi:MAG: PilZ domain-containing protein [Terracidiphilus sp.]|jgi:hypothetical protein
MADSVFKAEALVPIWVEKSGISVLDKLAQRPVLIEVEKLGKVMRGQMLQLTMSGATVLPDDSFLLLKSVHAKVSFRYSDVVYVLSGMTVESEADLRFSFKFDSVTRKSFAIMGKNLGEAGLLDAADVKQMYASRDTGAPDPEANSASPATQTKIVARLVRHEKPPGGRERRVHHRHDMDVGAKLAIVNSDSILNSSVMELSFGGCRVYTDLPNNIQLETLVEVQFVECGLPLRLAAKVQVKNGAHVLGLMYLNMSSRMRERLNHLIREIGEKERGQ